MHFFVCLTSLTQLIFFGFIYFVALSVVKFCCVVFHCMDMTKLVNEYLGCFQSLTIMHKTVLTLYGYIYLPLLLNT